MALRRNHSGFTLTELLFVIAIIAILASLAMPSFRSLIEGQRIKSASFEVYSALVLARSEAIKRNGSVTISPTTNAEGDVGLVVTSAGGETIRTVPPMKNVVITVIPNSVTSVTFLRTGRANVSPSFQLDVSATPTDGVRCIKLSLSGMPRTTKGVCS